MPWRRRVPDGGSSQWIEVSMNRYRFTIWLTRVLSSLLALLAGRIRNTFGFSLLVTGPILLFSVIVGWKLSGRIWPDRPSEGPLGLSDP
jgi:hypothetical protein